MEIVRPAKRNVIITFCDSGVGDFVSDNWLASLRGNVDLSDIDVVILDYGLIENQRARLGHAGAEVVSCKRDGAIVVIRFRDIATFLKNREYEQVMTTDGADIIFQTDVSILFEIERDELRAVPEYYKQPVDEMTRFQRFMTSDIAAETAGYLRDKKMVNAGVLIGPREKFIAMCDFCFEHIANKIVFGPDQPLITYYLYMHGFKELPPIYNFILYTARTAFKVRDGQFYDEKDALIPIVHNTGHLAFIRAVENFGFGPSHNTIRLRFYLFRALIKLRNFLRL